MTYQDLVEKLKISQETAPDRSDRFTTFKAALDFHREHCALRSWSSEGENVILVAGTNGKGTVSKTLETLLSENGSSAVGLFTSPHLMEPTERIRSHGRDLSQDEMVRAYQLVESAIRKFELSHFEILTLMMIEAFFGGRIRDVVTHAVIEVGVGGRLDPTRVIPHETAVITRIGLDHQTLLGSTLALIAKEKLAIAEGAKRLIYLKPAADPDLEKSFVEAKSLLPSCEFIEAREFASRVQISADTRTGRAGHPSWIIETPWGRAPLALLGDRAVQNTSLALEVLHRCGFNVGPMLRSLANVVWPGRMERLKCEGRDIYLSGDHNEQGVQSLVEMLAHFSYETLWLVVGIGKGKPVAAMLALYKKIPRARLILTRTSFRSLDIDALAPFQKEVNGFSERPIDALKLAINSAQPQDLIVVSGSLYLVGDLRSQILTADG